MRRDSPTAAFTLPELLVVLALIGIVFGASAGALWDFRRRLGLEAAARTGRAALARARMEAVFRGATVRLRRERRDPPELVLRDRDERPIARFVLGPASGAGLDSAVLRRSTLSFNSRGQAAPGSLYLFQDDRGIRLVVNFLGRVRREPFRPGG